MTSSSKPTQEELREYLAYDSLTGHLTWVKRPSKRIHIGTRAGNLNKSSGYRQLVFNGKNYPEHHIVWCIHNGEFPTHQIDHINQVRDCNLIENLREVTQAENSRNRSRNSKTHLDEAGIWYCRRRYKYVAEITYEGKKVYQRTFDGIEDAIKARKQELTKLGFHENHGTKQLIRK